MTTDMVLGPATRLLWRSPEEIHLELGQRSMVVGGLPAGLIRRIASRQGAVDDTELGPPTTREVLHALADAGYLWVRADEPDDLRLRPPVPRLAGELAALAVEHGPAAAEILDARRFSCIEVHGESRTAVHLAAVLAAAGVGHVRCTSAGVTRLEHASPGGLGPADEGRARSAAAEQAVRAAAPEVDAAPAADGHRADLTIIAVDAPVPNERRDALHAAGAPYLAVTLGVDHGIVGPLVLPGLTSCLRCADLHRTDRDPAWNALAVQLATPQRYGAPSSVALATVVAGLAALQALAFLDGGEPATLDGTLELHLPDWRLRRRSWSVHPECGCAGPDPSPCV